MCNNQVSEDTMFGLKDGKVIHISEIFTEDRGLKCNCTCVKCGQPLVARLGDIREHHFAHYNRSECEGSVETALHLYAKEVLENEKRIILPQLAINYYIKDNKVHFLRDLDRYYGMEIKEKIISNEQEIKFNRVEIEQYINDIKPDLLLYKNNKPLAVEVKVTHEVDEIKADKVKRLNISTLEIDLSKVFTDYFSFNRDEVINAIINQINIKKWIFNSVLEEQKAKFKIQMEKQIEERIIKEEEQLQRKLKYLMEKHDEKIEKVRLLLDEEYQVASKVKWDKELEANPKWINESRCLGITKETVPIYLNKPIEGEFVFDCDRRIWQTKVFNVFIYRWKSRRLVIDKVSIEYIVKWVKEKSGLPLNEPLIYTKDVEQEFPNIPSLSEVIYNFLLNLAEYGFVKPSDRSLRINGNHYYWWFDKIEDSITLEKGNKISGINLESLNANI